MAKPHRCDCFGGRPPVASVTEMAEDDLAKLREEHRPYQATGGILCLACTLPNNPDDPHASVTTFYPCLIARLIESHDASRLLAAERQARADEVRALREQIANLANKLNPKDFYVFEWIENTILDNESDPNPGIADGERDHWLINQTWIATLVTVDDLLAALAQPSGGERHIPPLASYPATLEITAAQDGVPLSPEEDDRG